MEQHKAELVKAAVDGASILTVIGTLSEFLPPLAALFTVIWTAIRIYETKTIQGLFKKEDQ
jgi:hypothetical protein